MRVKTARDVAELRVLSVRGPHGQEHLMCSEESEGSVHDVILTSTTPGVHAEL
jgi:hypothetical protein